MSMDSALTQGLKILFNILSAWDEPQSRLYWSHVLVTFLLVLGWSLTRSRIFRLWHQRKYTKLWSYFRRLLFAKNYWWHPSARKDYLLFLLNGILKSLVLSWNLGLSFYVARLTWSILELLWPSPHLVTGSVPLFMFTLLAFIFDDFLRFVHHYLSHKLPWLWWLHRVHHSAEVLTPITLFRTHPLESLMGSFRNGLSQGIISGFFVYLFQAPLTLWTVMGVNILGFTFNLLGANLRHSHIPLHFGPFWGRIFISPLAHQIHHSVKQEHHDKNFGVSLAIWDQLLGSWYPPKGKEKLRFGLSPLAAPTENKISPGSLHSVTN